MSEKGGKGSGIMKGKDDSASKSAKGRRLQFSNEVSPDPGASVSSKSGGKSESTTPIAGKGQKGEKGGKGSVVNDPQLLELNVEQELPENAKCLMDCEAAHILQGIQQNMVSLSKDPAIKIPISFDRGLQFAKSTTHYTSAQSVKILLEPLKEYGVSDSEICVIANMCPETVDEAFALVRSLKDKRSLTSERLKNVLIELSKLKQST